MSNGRGFNQDFSGWSSPGVDMQAVRDDRRAKIQDYVVDLGSAHSRSNGTALLVELPGTLLYADADPNGGNCIIHIEDSNLAVNSNAFYVQPGFTSRAPFTRLLIENNAQVGKTLRLHIGVDVDILPGSNQQVNISGFVDVADAGYPYGAAYTSNTPLVANTPVMVLSPASNINGVVVVDASVYSSSAAPVLNYVYLLAKASVPGGLFDGDVILGTANMSSGATGVSRLNKSIRVPAGRGLYFYTDVSEIGGNRSVLYSLL